MARTTTITLREIHCESCEHTNETALPQLDWVLRVSSSAKTNQVSVSYDELALNEANLRARLVEIGYDTL